ncbi:FxDxF family PEP-CTERM protein [Rhodoferax ferrireducens]|uniref:FxDxF family PEP-CTERM protein n=1 Tax=Rhodoferax ferrireducens TaxID=192843 RepID=UPI000E0D98E7|nr:FxDxF family PEP-CTERM protein [Rhodoferax ferrireducens]
MKLKTKIAVIAIAALSAASSFAYANGGAVGTLVPSAPFASTVSGEFTDAWGFSPRSSSTFDASVTNVAIAFSSLSFGAMKELSATFNGVSRFVSPVPVSNSSYTVTNPIFAGRTTLPAAGSFELKAAGTGISSGQASYVGDMAASRIPESGPLGMLLASLGLMGTIAVRRIKANAG